ncbi:MAG: hypothetical protein WDM71_07000 [Ferruginibacter sp.]
MAKENIEKGPRRISHVGYYLTGNGNAQTKKLAKAKYTTEEACREIVNKSPLFFYLSGIFILAGLICWGLIAKGNGEGLKNWRLILLSFISLIAARSIINVNYRMADYATGKAFFVIANGFLKGIPDEYRSMVVIPTILTTVASIEKFNRKSGSSFSCKQRCQSLFCFIDRFERCAAGSIGRR